MVEHPDDRKYLRRRRIVTAVSIVLAFAVMIFIAWIVVAKLLPMLKDPDQFREWIDSFGPWSRFVFMGLQVLQIIVATIPGEVLEIGAGYAFGAWEGTALCLIGILIGATLVFLLSRRFGVKLVEVFVSREKLNSIKWLNDPKRLELLMFIVYFIPGTPKDIFNYFAGVTPIKLWKFLLITTVARIPSVVTSTFGGHFLGERNYVFAIIVFGVTALISVAGIIFYNRWSKKKRDEHDARPKP